MPHARWKTLRRALCSLLALAAMLLSLSAPHAMADEEQGWASELDAKGLVSLASRFGQFADKLPTPSDLGIKKILSYEEHKHFVAVRGAGAGLQRRVVFCKPDTFLVEDVFMGKVPWDSWGIQCGAAVRESEDRARVREGTAHLTAQTLWPVGQSVQAETDRIEGQGVVGHVMTLVEAGLAKQQRLVYVVHVGKPGAVPPKAGLVEAGGALKATVKAGGKTFTVTFAADAAEAGAISVKGADGKVALAERPLPAGIMPHGPKGVRMLEGWDRAYTRSRRAPWDTGMPAPELVAAIKDGVLQPGKAVVLGCGSGTNSVYLAQKGFDVTAIDVAPTALMMGLAKAAKAKVKVRWLLADVLAVPEVGAFDVIFDRGCYHGVRRASATGFAKTVAALSKPGTRLLILAGNANEPRHYGPPRVDETDLVKDFATQWDFLWLKQIPLDAADSTTRRGAWFWSVLLRRKTPRK